MKITKLANSQNKKLIYQNKKLVYHKLIFYFGY